MSQTVLHPVLGSSLYIAQNIKTLPDYAFKCFRTNEAVRYYSLCDDFGPMNMASIIRFIELVDDQLAASPSKPLVYVAEPGRRNLTNAVFLLGAYMIIKLEYTLQMVASRFSWLDHSLVTPFRDATYATSDFDLTLMDCWSGLERGRLNGWVAIPKVAMPRVWGRIDAKKYELYDDPLHADLHEVVPGEFVAFKSPVDIGWRGFVDDQQGIRSFSPQHYSKILKSHRVTTVIQLNETKYETDALATQGIKHFQLDFCNNWAPPPAVIQEFLELVRCSKGAVGVHCKSGTGWSATIIALYMMQMHSFTAREAIGWLRIMRPGSILGQQQHYLCTVERCLAGPPPSLPAHGERTSAVQQVGARCEWEKHRALCGTDGQLGQMVMSALDRRTTNVPGPLMRRRRKSCGGLESVWHLAVGHSPLAGRNAPCASVSFERVVRFDL